MFYKAIVYNINLKVMTRLLGSNLTILIGYLLFMIIMIAVALSKCDIIMIIMIVVLNLARLVSGYKLLTARLKSLQRLDVLPSERLASLSIMGFKLKAP